MNTFYDKLLVCTLFELALLAAASSFELISHSNCSLSFASDARYALGDVLLSLCLNLCNVVGIFLDVVVVDPGGADGLRVEEPDQYCQLQHIVERDKVKHEASELVDHVKEAKDDPIGEPLLIVLALFVTLKSVE